MHGADVRTLQAPISSRPLTLADRLGGRENNLNLIRMAAASAVLISHAFPITLGLGAEEPLEQLTGFTLGTLAVVVFFALSGLLIARSFDRRPSVARFVIARIFRLFPALVVVLVLTVLAGIWLTSLDVAAYLTAPETLSYIPRNLSLAFIQYPLPGIFSENKYPDAINGSLWTLFYEVVCYAGVVALGLAGLLEKRKLFTFASSAIVVAFIYSLSWNPDGGILRRLDLLFQLAFPFTLGMLAYLWRDQVRLDWRIAALTWLACGLAYQSSLMPFFIVIALIYSVMWLAFVPQGALLQYNRVGDYSYGIYIYAFPVQQLLASVFPDAGPFMNMALAYPVALTLAVASWHLVERPALDHVDWATDRLSRRKLKAAT